MSESERRRRYRYNRVLIESERILTPQFADSVVYITGPQIEMLRNVTQYLNRLDTYVKEHHSGYYLTPDAADYDEILEIVADLEETLMGNPNTIWGYKDRYFEVETNDDCDAGTNNLYFSTVPAGEVWVINGIWAKNGTSVSAAIAMWVYFDSTLYHLETFTTPGADVSLNWTGKAILKEGDYIRVAFYGCTAGDDVLARARGYKMDVPT